ncbi:hypothetical protein GSY71_12195 [Pusillimonas sp. TS35]|jgi:uncharacterized OB-fold protein|uniref:Zn-ribbon domain-containing OB-fold protein n=1 Tax=Paracandidimonas lactea TaxID=2895524 RepID=UPI00136F0BDB|nr:OB-fold domain-containing protein [Paracandidimonas lactea]MYN13899.1 hypothetical protein [Pusillimonas sp. TS35]
MQSKNTPTEPGTRRLHGEYWSPSKAGQAVLTAKQCTSCGAGYLPAIATCVQCSGTTFRDLPLSHQGALYTYTIVHGSGGVWPKVYAIGYVDYPEGVRVCGHISETESGALQIGMPMSAHETTLYKDKEGVDVKCFRFEPAQEEK